MIARRCRVCKQEGELIPCEGPGCRWVFHIGCMYPAERVRALSPAAAFAFLGYPTEGSSG
jgi:hypothetical protein